MAKRGMSLAQQQAVLDKLEKAQKSLSNVRSNARSNQDEMKRTATVIAGGAAAGALDAWQQMKTDKGEDNPLSLIKDVPGEAIVGIGGAVVALGMKKSKSQRMLLDLSKGMLAYSAGKMAREKVLESAA